MLLKDRSVNFRVDKDTVSKTEFMRFVKNIAEYTTPEVFMQVDDYGDTEYITYLLNWQRSMYNEDDGEAIDTTKLI